MVFVWWVNILLWLTNGSFWRLKHSRDCWSIICWCLFLLRSLSLRRGRCFPSCYLVSSQGLSMVMLIFPEISNIFWLWERLLGFCILHCYSFRNREGEFQRASKWSVGCPCSVSLGAGIQVRGDGMLPCYSARKPVKQKFHRDEMGFSEWKRQQWNEMKLNGLHISVFFVQ